MAQNKNRINKAGELLVTSELSRSQQRNLSDCIQKISAIIAEASEKPHEPTAEDVALRAQRYYPVIEHNEFLSTLNICVFMSYSMFVFNMKYVVQIREEEQRAAQPEKDSFNYQEEQTSGFWLIYSDVSTSYECIYNNYISFICAGYIILSLIFFKIKLFLTVSLVWNTYKSHLSKSKDTSLDNDFSKSQSCSIDYNLSKSLKVTSI